MASAHTSGGLDTSADSLPRLPGPGASTSLHHWHGNSTDVTFVDPRHPRVSLDGAVFEAAGKGLLPHRYEVRGKISAGGQADVLRAWDRHIGREVAVKVLRSRTKGDERTIEALREEVRVGAGLDHPSLLRPIDWGLTEASRVFLVLPYVADAITLEDALADALSREERYTPLRLLKEVVLPLSRTMAWVHRQGVVHRDLKPRNVLIREDGHHFVIDFGLSDRRGVVWDAEREPAPLAPRDGGTPSAMSPEQVRGGTTLDPRLDVYSLGVMLYQLLAGRPPHVGTREEVLAALRAGVVPEPPPDLQPPGLATVCMMALSSSPDARQADAGVFATQLAAWIDEQERGEKAGAFVRRAKKLAVRHSRLRARLRDQQETVRGLRAGPDAVREARLEEIWAMEDDIVALEHELDTVEESVSAALGAALTVLPTFTAAWEHRADWLRHRHADAERAGDRRTASRLMARLQEAHRGRHTEYIQGDGAISLALQRAAHVTVRRLVRRGPLRVADAAVWNGFAPLERVPLPMGAYLAEIRTEDAVRFVLPFRIRRQQHVRIGFDGGRRGRPLPVPLPDTIDWAEECFVPGDVQRVGGDPEAAGAALRDAHEIAVGDLVVRRRHVTLRAWLRFLDAVCAAEGAHAVAPLLPRLKGAAGKAGTPLASWDAARGRHVPTEGLDLDGPVTSITWDAASAFAAWESARTGREWRLPTEVEFSRYSRGDDRVYPWGDGYEPGFCANRDQLSRDGLRAPGRADRCPRDVSVFGVAVVAGGLSELMASAWQEHPDPRRPLPVDAQTRLVAVRGGHFLGSAAQSRLATRAQVTRAGRSPAVGIRLVRDL